MRAWLVIGALAVALGGCEQAPWQPGEGRVAVRIASSGPGNFPRGGRAVGNIALRTTRGETRVPFDTILGSAGLMTSAGMSIGGDAGAPGVHWFADAIVDGLACDPAAGDVEVAVQIDALTPVSLAEGVASVVGAERRVTVPCEADVENGGTVRFEMVDVDSAGELVVRVVLDEPPPGATGGTAIIKVRSASGVGGTATYPPFEGVALSREGDRLVGEWTSLCVGDYVRRAQVGVGALDVPGLDEPAVWALWPPPEPVTGDVACVLGERREVEVHLAPRTP